MLLRCAAGPAEAESWPEWVRVPAALQVAACEGWTRRQRSGAASLIQGAAAAGAGAPAGSHALSQGGIVSANRADVCSGGVGNLWSGGVDVAGCIDVSLGGQHSLLRASSVLRWCSLQAELRQVQQTE